MCMTRCACSTSCTGKRHVRGDSAYQGQSEVIRSHAPKANTSPTAATATRIPWMRKNGRRIKPSPACAPRSTSFPHHQVYLWFREDPLQGLAKNAPACCHLRADQSVPDAPAAVATVGGVVCLQYGKRGEDGPLTMKNGPHGRVSI